MTVAEIKAKLDDLGITYKAKARKAELEALLPSETTETEVVEVVAPEPKSHIDQLIDLARERIQNTDRRRTCVNKLLRAKRMPEKRDKIVRQVKNIARNEGVVLAA